MSERKGTLIKFILEQAKEASNNYSKFVNLVK